MEAVVFEITPIKRWFPPKTLVFLIIILKCYISQNDNENINSVIELYPNISCKSSSSYSDFNAEIKGTLTSDGVAISNEPILISYSVTGGRTWEDLTLVYTGSDGSYSVVWNPLVTGSYLIKALYEGNEDYSVQTTIVNLASTQFDEKNVFSVTSNSTVSGLVFKSDSQQLGFRVEGPSGTIGYVDVYIAKSMIGDINAVETYLDGEEIDYTATSVSDSWLLHFFYEHSTHEVLVSLGSLPSESFLDSPLGMPVIIGAILAIIVAVVLVMMRKRKAS